jgi:hypothetical protein
MSRSSWQVEDGIDTIECASCAEGDAPWHCLVRHLVDGLVLLLQAPGHGHNGHPERGRQLAPLGGKGLGVVRRVAVPELATRALATTIIIIIIIIIITTTAT